MINPVCFFQAFICSLELDISSLEKQRDSVEEEAVGLRDLSRKQVDTLEQQFGMEEIIRIHNERQMEDVAKTQMVLKKTAEIEESIKFHEDKLNQEKDTQEALDSAHDSIAKLHKRLGEDISRLKATKSKEQQLQVLKTKLIEGTDHKLVIEELEKKIEEAKSERTADTQSGTSTSSHVPDRHRQTNATTASFDFDKLPQFSMTSATPTMFESRPYSESNPSGFQLLSLRSSSSSSVDTIPVVGDRGDVNHVSPEKSKFTFKYPTKK